MDSILTFLSQHGLWLTLIAVVGIIVLGVLKYCNIFSKLDKKYRHICYMGISVGLSLIGSVIYLACIKHFDWNYIFALAAAILALNQTFYALYDTLSLKELMVKLLDWVKGLIKDKEKVDEIKEVVDEAVKKDDKEEK